MTVLLVIVINFFLFRVMPGNPIEILITPGLTQEMKLAEIHRLGLDRPLLTQFLIYVGDLFKGEFGQSFITGRSVKAMILQRLPNTILLMISANILSILMGITLGVLAAWKRGTRIDISLIVTSLTLYSMPVFWLGGIMLLYLSVQLDLFPLFGVVVPGITHLNTFSYIADVANHLFLPMMCLALSSFGGLFLVMRNTLLDIFAEDYVLTARAIGLSNRTIMFNNVLKNAMLPMITVIAIRLGFSVSGAILTETIFSWPGMGLTIYQAVTAHDYPVLQATFLIITILVILANFMADIAYGYIDPRIRYG